MKHARERYSVFGLQVDSDIPLPELFPGSPDLPADVTVELGRVPLNGDLDFGVHAVEGGALLLIEEVGGYFVAGGRRVVVEPKPDASERNVRLFLLGSVFGLLLHQRHLLPLHANAIEIDGKIVAFMGKSGVGKSTLAAWMSDQGFRLIADDVTVVSVEGGTAMVRPGLPRLRLWHEVIEATGRNPEHFSRSFEGESPYNKRDVLLPQTKVVREVLELGAVVELARSGPLLELRTGIAAADAIFSNTYRGAFIRTVETTAEHWASCIRLVQAVPVYRSCVSFDLQQLSSSYEPLLAEVRQILNGSKRSA